MPTSCITAWQALRKRNHRVRGKGKGKAFGKQATENNKPEQDDSNDTGQPSPSGQQQQQTAVKEEEKAEGETPRAEEGGDVAKDESSTGSPGAGKEKKHDTAGDVATAEVVVAADAAAEGVAADAAAVGANTAKEEAKEETEEEVLKTTSGGGAKEDNRVRTTSSQLKGAAREKTDDGAGGGGEAAAPAGAGTKIEERADAKPETRVAPGEQKPAAVAQGGEDKRTVEKEPRISAAGGQPENDSSDDDDGDGFRIVVGREVAPPAAPAAPTKRFLRGTNSLVNTNNASAAGAEESRSTPGPKPVSAAAGIASLVPSKGAPVATERPSLKPGQYPPTAELQQSTGKTAFDVDIDGMEEQPWRHPGVDIADFFNYGFTEDSWRVYCEKQLRNRYDRTRVRPKNTITTSSRGGRSGGHMRHAGGGARRGGDRPGGAEVIFSPTRRVQLHNNGPPGQGFRQQGPAGKAWGGAGPGPDRFAQGFGSAPPSGHGNSATPWFDGQSQMRPKGRQNFGPGSAGGQGRGGGQARQGNGNAMGGSAGARRDRSPDPRDGPNEKMARTR
ncbi:unnamed protein product [Laminaria digitata]